jgi:Domain of unknown function (DUF4936)
MSVPTELYCYYRVPAVTADAARAEIAALHQRLRAALPGLQARLLQRTDTAESTDATWMETYCHPEGLGADALSHIVDAGAALPTGRVGPRHLERFAPLR